MCPKVTAGCRVSRVTWVGPRLADTTARTASHFSRCSKREEDLSPVVRSGVHQWEVARKGYRDIASISAHRCLPAFETHAQNRIYICTIIERKEIDKKKVENERRLKKILHTPSTLPFVDFLPESKKKEERRRGDAGRVREREFQRKITPSRLDQVKLARRI